MCHRKNRHPPICTSVESANTSRYLEQRRDLPYPTEHIIGIADEDVGGGVVDGVIAVAEELVIAEVFAQGVDIDEA